MTSDLTPRQQSVLEYVITFQQEHCMAPTLKTVNRNRYSLMLLPANSALSPLVFKGPQRKQVAIIGKLVGVVRRR